MDILYVGISFLFFTASWMMIHLFENLDGGDG